MAKKKPAATPDPEDTKNGKQQRAVRTTPNDLRHIAYRLKEAAIQIEAQADKMENEKITSAMLEGRAGVEGAKGCFWQLGKLLASCHRHITQF